MSISVLTVQFPAARRLAAEAVVSGTGGAAHPGRVLRRVRGELRRQQSRHRGHRQTSRDQPALHLLPDPIPPGESRDPETFADRFREGLSISRQVGSVVSCAHFTPTSNLPDLIALISVLSTHTSLVNLVAFWSFHSAPN